MIMMNQEFDIDIFELHFVGYESKDLHFQAGFMSYMNQELDMFL